jgi:hypothetical protein
VRPRGWQRHEEEEQSPLTRARQAARRIWFEFDRTLGRKYDLVGLLRSNRLSPEDEHRVNAVLAEINGYLQDLDGQLDVAEARVRQHET